MMRDKRHSLQQRILIIIQNHEKIIRQRIQRELLQLSSVHLKAAFGIPSCCYCDWFYKCTNDEKWDWKIYHPAIKESYQKANSRKKEWNELFYLKTSIMSFSIIFFVSIELNQQVSLHFVSLKYLLWGTELRSATGALGATGASRRLWRHSRAHSKVAVPEHI